MSEPYQIACLFVSDVDAESSVPRSYRVLMDEGLGVAEDSLLLLHDTQSYEPEPRPIVDTQSALRELIDWPTLGSLDLAGPDGMVTMSYLGSEGRLECLLISLLPLGIERSGSLPRYQRLAERLHNVMGATRTIMAWGLEMRGFDYRQELSRLRQNVVTGEYELLDLH